MGTTKALPVTFRNDGGLPCDIAGVTISGSLGGLGGPNDAAFFRVESPSAATLLPGDTMEIVVEFLPDAARAYGSDFGSLVGGFGFALNLQVDTSDTASFDGTTCSSGGFLGSGSGSPGCVAWGLLGQGVSSDLSVLPGDLDFGKVKLGCRSREESVTLYNTGLVPMTLRSFVVDPVAQPELFKVIGPSLPYTLNGGAQVAFSVRYMPSAPGPQVSSLL
ncbi:MAG: Abnormal spindle-like microcephaly-assocd, ASPM-SPD-2-Hydin, partial [Pseudomonadota bacterium]